ncbi:MAG TPA: DegT/DnrJ/EryC1/StrS family aminotransferase [Planctomycetaceae bacterium]|nr:DegT/DnrJ/EryC1/StrS family aminotransferase [Planctomycetaceae bacterium]HIQ19882.1 DegT/DnrJ/EryC1/StrS family aminotransferase [Planctomycetota bacterium]
MLAAPPIALVDLKGQHAAIAEELNEAIGAVLAEAAFAGGRFVERFEQQFARFCQCDHAIGVGSGTEALWLALRALGVGSGDEVITVPNTFIATAEAIAMAGARTVLVDVDPATGTMDPEALERAFTRRTRAVIPVHLYGHPADMEPILEIARRRGVKVVEDACQAHGALYRGRPAGSMGDAGCFSFYPGKNLGACGDAGAVVTNDPQLAEAIRALRDHGQRQKHEHLWAGWNARMDGIQAAVLSVKLKYLPAWNEGRRRRARLYDTLLAEVPGIRTPREASYATSVYHLYVIRTGRRDALREALARNNIHCGIHYPIPLHRQPAWQQLGRPAGRLPEAERWAASVLSLPLCPVLTSEAIRRIAGAVRAFAEAEQPEAVPCELGRRLTATTGQQVTRLE